MNTFWYPTKKAKIFTLPEKEASTFNMDISSNEPLAVRSTTTTEIETFFIGNPYKGKTPRPDL